MDQFIFVSSLAAILLILTLSMISYIHKGFVGAATVTPIGLVP